MSPCPICLYSHPRVDRAFFVGQDQGTKRSPDCSRTRMMEFVLHYLVLSQTAYNGIQLWFY